MAQRVHHVSLDREELRKRGQAALEKLRGTRQESDRKRLIEEGRRLVKQSRSSFLNEKGPTAMENTNGQLPTLPAPMDVATKATISATAPSLTCATTTVRKPPPPPHAPATATKSSKLHTISRGVATKVTKKLDLTNTVDDDGWDFDDF
jgi:hypothetical protein